MNSHVLSVKQLAAKLSEQQFNVKGYPVVCNGLAIIGAVRNDKTGCVELVTSDEVEIRDKTERGNEPAYD